MSQWTTVLSWMTISAVFFLPLSIDLATGLLLIAALLCLFHVVWTGNLVVRRSSFDLSLSVFIALAALSIPAAPELPVAPYIWFDGFYNWVHVFGRCVLVYVLAVHLLRPGRDYRLIIYVLLASAALVSVYGLYQYVVGVDTSAERWVDKVHFPWLKTRAFSTLGNPNILAGFLVMSIGLAIGAIFESARAQVRQSAALAVPLMIGCIAATFSRGAWVALGIMGLAAAALKGRRAILIGVAGIVLAAILVSFAHGDVMERLRSIANPADSSANLRLLLWESTWNMIVDRPLLGWGWTSYPRICLDYNVYVREENSTIYHAHNTFLHYAAEIGIAGMLAFTWAWLAMMFQLLKLRARPSADTRMFATAAWLALIGLGGFCLTDHLLFNIQIGMLFWLMLGLTGRLSEQKRNNYWIRKKYCGLAGFFSRPSNKNTSD